MTPAPFSLADGDNLTRYLALSEEQLEEWCGWFRLHGVDERDVPISATILFDADTREWLIPVYVRGDAEREVDVLRRPWRADIPELAPDPDALAEAHAQRARFADEIAIQESVERALLDAAEALAGEFPDDIEVWGESPGWFGPEGNGFRHED